VKEKVVLVLGGVDGNNVASNLQTQLVEYLCYIARCSLLNPIQFLWNAIHVYPLTFEQLTT
jgi:hypothetical protein